MASFPLRLLAATTLLQPWSADALSLATSERALKRAAPHAFEASHRSRAAVAPSAPGVPSLATMATVSAEGPTVASVPDGVVTTDAVICGGGPAGLLSAIMLARKFPDRKVRVFDRLRAPPSPTDEEVWSDVSRFYLIGLGSRGQRALAEFGVWEEVRERSVTVLGRKDWAPDSDEGVERIFTDRPTDTEVLPRDKLVGVLHQLILDNYSDSIDLNYGYEVDPIDFEAEGGNAVLVRVSKCSEGLARVNPASAGSSDGAEPDVFCDPYDSVVVSTKVLIAADGTSRTIANRIEEHDRVRRRLMSPMERLLAPRPFSVKRYDDDNQRVYKTVPMRIPQDWRPDLNYSARTKSGRVVFDALPANRDGDYCGVLLLKKEDPLARGDTDPTELRRLLDEHLPQFSALVDDGTVAQVAKKPPSFLPGFRYAGPRLNQGDRTIILGDCAHTVKPYFGLGANSALEDVKCLGDIIDSTDGIPQAVRRFSKERAGEAKALVRLSRELDRPGPLGFITFILPLILDSIFHGMAPGLFAPNTIAMLQKEGVDFRSVARRKRLDRMGQIALLGGTVSVIATGARAVVNRLAVALGTRRTTVVAGTVLVCAGLVVLRKLAAYLVPGMAPADVLNKTKGKISDDSEETSFFFGRKKKRA